MIEKNIKHKNPKSKYVGLVVDGHENEIIERRIWSDYQEISFEKQTFCSVKDTDSYLKHAYGNYMELPPESERVPKHDFYKMYWIE